MQVGDTFTVVALLGGGESSLKASQAGVTIEDVFDRPLLGGRHLLRDMRDHPAGRSLDLAGLAAQAAEDHRKQAGFAAAVGADQGEVLSRLNRQLGMLEQQFAAPAKFDVA